MRNANEQEASEPTLSRSSSFTVLPAMGETKAVINPRSPKKGEGQSGDESPQSKEKSGSQRRFGSSDSVHRLKSGIRNPPRQHDGPNRK
jgi:hypothetical protein